MFFISFDSIRWIIFILAICTVQSAFSQTILSLENSHKFKRIRFETGQEIKMKAHGISKRISGPITRITPDSVYIGGYPVLIDSIRVIFLPRGKNFSYWIVFFSSGIPGAVFLTLVSASAAISALKTDPKAAIQPAIVGSLSLAMLYALYKMTFRHKSIGKHWQLKAIDIPLAP